MSDQVNTEKYNNNPENELQQAHIQPVSTFSVDVDTGSYTNSRRMLNMGNFLRLMQCGLKSLLIILIININPLLI